MPRLSLDGLTRTFDGVDVVSNLSLDVAAGEIVCLLGPSGCGKSTTLRMAAGVERQDQGRVLIDGDAVSGPGLHMPPEDRAIGLMFQDFALFPHLTVAGNVGFGLTRRTPDRDGIVTSYLGKVGLAGYAHKYPHMLSGGEQQRVALARALAPKPRIMLMDEPFSGLDNRLRDGVRDEALAILKEEGTAVLLVTHEPDEAMRMADRIALMRSGKIVQIGAPYAIYHHPADRQAAAFFSDVNVVQGVVRNQSADTPFGSLPAPGIADNTPVEIVVRPQHLDLHADTGVAPIKTNACTEHAHGLVVRSRFVGAQSVIEVRLEYSEDVLRATVPYAYLPEPGTAIWLGLRRDHCFVFPSATQGKVASPLAAE